MRLKPNVWKPVWPSFYIRKARPRDIKGLILGHPMSYPRS